ncbi:MAG: SRPBCC family protein [Gammaproteobacteria bacterium]|nr:SRPBCC family protein [Gammaproteobacteria bacterium]
MQPRRGILGLLVLALACAIGPARASPAGPAPSLAVEAIDAGRGAAVSAAIRVRAPPDALWRVLTSCAEALRVVPRLRACVVQRSAADGSWQQIREVVGWSWYLPQVSYVVRADYRAHTSIEFAQISGDLALLRGRWLLQRDGSETVAHYSFEVVPRFWVPGWLLRLELRRDLPRMLQALRERAESASSGEGEERGAAAGRGR